MISADRINSLKDDLRKLKGLAPYNDMLNPCYGDGYFYQSLIQKHGKRLVEKTLAEMGEDVRTTPVVAETPKPTPVVKEQPRTKKVSKPGAKVQDAIDEYIQVHAEMKELEKRLKELRDKIEPYMEENNMNEVVSSDGKVIGYVPMSRPIVTARYSSYDVDDVDQFLTIKQKAQCIVRRVDAEKLDALVTLGQVDEAIKELKITNPTKNFTVKK